jgi:hypothetical protein
MIMMISLQDYIEYPLFLKYLIHLSRRKLRQPGFQVTGFTKILLIARPVPAWRQAGAGSLTSFIDNFLKIL